MVDLSTESRKHGNQMEWKVESLFDCKRAVQFSRRFPFHLFLEILSQQNRERDMAFWKCNGFKCFSTIWGSEGLELTHYSEQWKRSIERLLWMSLQLSNTSSTAQKVNHHSLSDSWKHLKTNIVTQQNFVNLEKLPSTTKQAFSF